MFSWSHRKYTELVSQEAQLGGGGRSLTLHMHQQLEEEGEGGRRRRRREEEKEEGEGEGGWMQTGTIHHLNSTWWITDGKSYDVMHNSIY